MERGRETVGAVHSRYSVLYCLEEREEKKELEESVFTQSYSNWRGGFMAKYNSRSVAKYVELHTKPHLMMSNAKKMRNGN